jgi:hypothetical protein
MYVGTMSGICIVLEVRSQDGVPQHIFYVRLLQASELQVNIRAEYSGLVLN